MTPKQIKQARHTLGLSLSQLAAMLGYQSDNPAGLRTMGAKLEDGRRTLRDPQRRLLDAYLSGYRPDDWP
ncbi:MAG: hypothetical protein AAFV54_17055, partial [Pseudomonadota bacterium]